MERETQEDESRLDLYAVLELTREASLDEIRIAFRKIAAKNHPDRNEGDSKAALRFKRANAAYQVLSDPEKRDLYDQLTTPIEEIPQAPPPDAMVRGNDARDWRAPDEPRGTQSTRRRRRRVRKTSAMTWAWGVTIGAGLLILVAWILVPEGGSVRPVAASSAESSATSPPKIAVAPESVTDPGMGSIGSIGTNRLGAPGDPATNPSNPRERGSAATPVPAEDDVPVRAVTGDKWSFDVPTDWRSSGDANATAWQAPGEGGATVTLVVSTFVGESAAFFKSLDRKSRGGLVVDNESWESESHPDGLRREGRIVHGSTVVSQFVEYVVAVHGHGYDLRCTAPVVTFDGVVPMCERILGSLQIK